MDWQKWQHALTWHGHQLALGILVFLIALDGMCPEGLSNLLGMDGKSWWLFLLATGTFARSLYLVPAPPDSGPGPHE